MMTSRNEKVVDHVSAYLEEHFIRFEPTDDDKYDSYMFMGLVFDEKNKEESAIGGGILGSVKSLAFMMYDYGKREQKFRQALLQAAEFIKTNDMLRRANGEDPDSEAEPCPDCGRVHPPMSETLREIIDHIRNRRSHGQSRPPSGVTFRETNENLTITDESIGG